MEKIDEMDWQVMDKEQTGRQPQPEFWELLRVFSFIISWSLVAARGKGKGGLHAAGGLFFFF